jgi:flagellar assembly protein FliH
MASANAAQALKYEFAPLTRDGAGNGDNDQSRALATGELEAVRAAAFSAGEASAREASGASLAHCQAEAIEAAGASLRALVEGIEATRGDIETAAAALSHAVGRAIAGHAIARAPLEVIRPMIAEALDALYGQAHVVIEVHEAVAGIVAAELDAIVAETGFAGRVRVRAGARGIADCRIDWGEGGIERRAAEIAREIADRAAAYGIALPPAVIAES